MNLPISPWFIRSYFLTDNLLLSITGLALVVASLNLVVASKFNLALSDPGSFPTSSAKRILPENNKIKSFGNKNHTNQTEAICTERGLREEFSFRCPNS